MKPAHRSAAECPSPQGARPALTGFLPSALVAMLLAASPVVAQQPPPPTVATVEVSRAPLAAASRWDGTVEAVRQTRVAAQATGRVVKLLAKAGESVKAGQVLAEVDAQEATLGTTRAQAALAQAQAATSQARLALTRNEQLRRDGFISQAALDAARTTLTAAEAAEREAAAAVASARVATGYYRLTAPYDAIVSARQVEIGDLILPGRSLFELYAPDLMRVVVQMPTAQAIALGRQIRASTPAPQPRPAAAKPGAADAPRAAAPSGQPAATPSVAGAATVRRSAQEPPIAARAVEVLPAANAATGTTEVRIELPQGSVDNWRPGEHVQVEIALEARATTTVPAGAVIERGELQVVYVERDGRFVLRPVRTGRVYGTGDTLAVEVLAGLQPGERIAVDPVRAGLRGALAQ
ncbi:MAG: efflux RND transporter periplasmic adaptor subunit [Lautropia sp.]